MRRTMTIAAILLLGAAVPVSAQEEQEPANISGDSWVELSFATAADQKHGSKPGVSFGGGKRLYRWVELDVNVNAVKGWSLQTGVGFPLAPDTAFVVPVIRVGVALADLGGVTGGFGLRIGRRRGFTATADIGSSDGIRYGIVHAGGFISFGG